MPNTIAHFAVNGLVTRKLMPEAALPLVYVGCVVPDLPWITQRAAKVLIPGLDPYDVRLYCINQASLVSCLVFSAAFALIFQRWRLAFVVLALGSLLHLLLDACQIKWANGVSLFVPFDWRLIRFDLFWPESPWTLLLTFGGLVYFIANFGAASRRLPEVVRQPKRWALAGVLLACWLSLPFLWMDDASAANNHCVGTLRPEHRLERVGKVVGLDRIPFDSDAQGGGDLVIFGGERVQAEEFDPGRDANVSVLGRFTAVDRISVHDSHIHHGWAREVASYVGLALVALVWLRVPSVSLARWIRSRRQSVKSPQIS